MRPPGTSTSKVLYLKNFHSKIFLTEEPPIGPLPIHQLHMHLIITETETPEPPHFQFSLLLSGPSWQPFKIWHLRASRERETRLKDLGLFFLNYLL